jgi:hypothetical protein
MKNALPYILITLVSLTACDKWYTTKDVSHESELPKFNLTGGKFISIRKTDSLQFEDPGVTAESGGQKLTVYYSGTVIDTAVGVYIISYYATNSDGLKATAERIVAVTDFNVSYNDLSGTYKTSAFGEEVDSKVKRIDSAGYYESEDVMGYPGYKMPGHFVDIGNAKLVLLHGSGYFGSYDGSEGTYSIGSLSWTIYLLDEPNTGVSIPVVWRKKD